MPKKPRWESAKDKLVASNVTEETIMNLLKNKESNAEKYKALIPLLKENNIVSDTKKEHNNNLKEKIVTLEDFFGKNIAKLLIEQKKLRLEIDESLILDNKLESKNVKEAFEDASNKELLYKYLQNDIKKKRLEEINKELEYKGIIYNPIIKKKENNTKENAPKPAITKSKRNIVK